MAHRPDRETIARFLIILERELPTDVVVGQPMNLTSMQEAAVIEATMAWLRSECNR